MRLKKPVRAALDQVRITRDGGTAVIEHADTTISTTNLTIGDGIKDMTDIEILAVYNSVIEAQEQSLRDWDNAVTEIPPGKPQIKYESRSDQWVPRGEVVRCLISDDAEGEAVIHVDDHELSLREFGRLLRVYAGWGMRIEFVPEELITERPKIKVREPRRRRK
jgi:hypothetical protein